MATIKAPELTADYYEITEAELPLGADRLYWHTPTPRRDGDLVEVRYSTGVPGEYREAYEGDAYRLVVDCATGAERFYRHRRLRGGL
jgi:hypothetical protein